MADDIKPASFLGLPYHLRERIYRETGLVHGVTIYLDNTDHFWSGMRGNFPSDITAQFDFNLLHTCSTTRLEIIKIIFSQNSLHVPCHNIHHALNAINYLSPELVASLTNLTVDLYIHNNSSWMHYDISEILQDNIPDLWELTITRVLSIVPPKQLSLSFAFDGGDIDITRTVLGPLLRSPGVLKDLELRLDDHKEPHLSLLAHDMAKTILGRKSDLPQKPFPYLDLPREIRQHILEYTDLVTPYRCVEWKHGRGFYAESVSCHPRDGCYLVSEKECDEKHRGHRFSDCAKRRPGIMKHICNRRYSVYSTQCKCWEPPQYLFLVNKAMCIDAASVFYANNHVVVTPTLVTCQSVTWRDMHTRLHPSRFITRNMEKDVLHHLRSLELVMSPLKNCFQPEPSDPVLLDWQFAIEHLGAHADLSKLTLIIHILLEMSAHSQCETRLPHDSGWRKTVRGGLISLGDDMPSRLKVHMSLLKPLQKLRALNRFFVHLEWPWHWSPDTSAWSDLMYFPDKDKLSDQVDEMELWLERFVMGEDYDSHALGKREQMVSHWLSDAWIYDGLLRMPSLP